MAFLPQCAQARETSTQMSGLANLFVSPTVFDHIPKVLCSPLQWAGGGSKATTPSKDVLMILSSDAIILLVLLAVWGQPAAVMAKPIAQMPVLFDEAGPSQGGEEGIFKLEDNIHCNLGSNLIFVTPFPWIPPYVWYRNLTTWNNKASTTHVGQLLLLFQVA
jgi:hypothetical protein